MTKTEIVKWLELKKSEKLKALKVIKNEKIKEREDHLFEELGLIKSAAIIQQKISEAHDEILKLRDSFDSKNITIHIYYGIMRDICNHSNNKSVLESMIDNVPYLHKEDKIVMKLTSKFDRLEDEIETNYNNVINVVKSLSTAKKGLEYLYELGFDTTELIKTSVTEVTAVTVPVDKNFLFINRGEIK